MKNNWTGNWKILMQESPNMFRGEAILDISSHLSLFIATRELPASHLYLFTLCPFIHQHSRILTKKTNLLAGFHGARVCPYIIYHTGTQQPLSKSLSIQILTSLKLLLSSISSPGILISPTILSLTISLWWNPLKWSRKDDSGKFQWLQYHSHQLGKSHVRNTFWQTLNSMTWPI